MKLFNKTFRKALTRQLKNWKVAGGIGSGLGLVGGFGLGRLSKNSEKQMNDQQFLHTQFQAFAEPQGQAAGKMRAEVERRSIQKMQETMLPDATVKQAIKDTCDMFRCSEQAARDYIFHGTNPSE